jgi:FkbM family methyltransferase
MKQMRRPIFGFLRTVLVLLTGRGYDRAPWMNDLHHKLSYRLHKLLPEFGITGIQKVQVPGMPNRFMYVRAEDGGVAHQLIMYREYEPYESSLVREYLKPGMTVYNIGANLGYYTLVASECIGRNGKIYAFEPAPENFELLTRTVSENKLTNVELFPSAVGAAKGSATLSLSRTNSGDHQLQNVASRDHIVVDVVSVDSFITEGHAPPDAIIMDVQGAEFDVLKGAPEVLASKKSLLLFTEFWHTGLDERHPNGAKKMLDMLEGAGFQLNVMDEKHRSVRKIMRDQLLKEFSGHAEANLLCIR